MSACLTAGSTSPTATPAPSGARTRKILVQLKASARQTHRGIHQRFARESPPAFSRRAVLLQPADIVTQILNFGTPAPIDVEITGMNQRGNYLIGEKLANEFRHIPGAVDVHVQQALITPRSIWKSTVPALNPSACSRATSRQNVLVSLSSSFQTAPAFWLDPKNGVEYNVAVQEPAVRVDSYQALQNTPISGSMPGFETSDSG